MTRRSDAISAIAASIIPTPCDCLPKSDVKVMNTVVPQSCPGLPLDEATVALEAERRTHTRRARGVSEERADPEELLARPELRVVVVRGRRTRPDGCRGRDDDRRYVVPLRLVVLVPGDENRRRAGLVLR